MSRRFGAALLLLSHFALDLATGGGHLLVDGLMVAGVAFGAAGVARKLVSHFGLRTHVSESAGSR